MIDGWNSTTKQSAGTGSLSRVADMRSKGQDKVLTYRRVPEPGRATGRCMTMDNVPGMIAVFVHEVKGGLMSSMPPFI